MRRVQHHRQVEAGGEPEQPLEARTPPSDQPGRVGGGAEVVPGEPDLAHRDDARVVLGDLAFHLLEIRVGKRLPFRVEAEHGPHRLAVAVGHRQGARIGGGIAAHRHHTPHVRVQRAHERAPSVREDGVVQVAVAVDDHAPATTMRPMRSVGAAVRSRKTRSLPTPSTAWNISRRLPATVISSTG